MIPDSSCSTWSCGDLHLETSVRSLIMGIVNVTPDSFSGDGKGPDAAIEHALSLEAQGADILDIGGESTRPGSEEVSEEEEMRRVLPVVEALAVRAKIPVAVDTNKPAVAVAAVNAGARIVNDISAGTWHPAMHDSIAGLPCGYVLMHHRGLPKFMQASQASHVVSPATSDNRRDIIAEVLDFWRKRMEAAVAAGISRDRIVLDAGFGFGKSVEENLALISRGDELLAAGRPMLSGTSRKSTIGKVLDKADPLEREWGHASCVAIAIFNGASIIRVHEVAISVQVARMADAIVRVRQVKSAIQTSGAH